MKTLVVLFAVLWTAAAQSTVCPSDNAAKFDCYPDADPRETECVARGCCYESSSAAGLLPSRIPRCFYPVPYKTYRYLNITETQLGLTAYFELVIPSGFRRDVISLRLDVEEQTNNRLRVKISDSQTHRYESPYPKVPTTVVRAENPTYTVSISNQSLGFQVKRMNGDILFDTVNLGGFIFSDQFIQISSRYTGQMYGLGEHRTNLWLSNNWTSYTMFNFGPPPKEGYNLPGSHPFYLVVEDNGASHGVFLKNSNAMDVLLQPLPAVTFRTIGGILDFYYFMGPTPADVISQYTELIGRPHLPPYWSLGFHLCRYGYGSANRTREVWERTVAAKIPFDTQWNDIDMMDKRNIFTVDPVNFGNLPELVQDIHDAGMHYMVILDPGMSGSEPEGTYMPYEDAVRQNVLVKDYKGDVFLGKVWNPDTTAFVDFTHPNATGFWTENMRKLQETIKFDGMWIDMNEPYNFINGSIDGCPVNEVEYPQYKTGVAVDMLHQYTVCMTAQQYAGLHYNVHNIYSIAQAEITQKAVKEVLQKRPFVLSRSNFAGSGAYTAHWSGDNYSTWYDLKKSIFEILSFSLFGMAFTGADICGHNDVATPELCSRWHQLGAFYPFSRNHANNESPDQDPVALGPLVVDSARTSLNARYTVLPYLYTLMYRAHVYGETVARPLFFEFLGDKNTYKMDESFLWGPALYIVPVIQPNETTVSTYLPEGRWYDAITGDELNSTGEEVTLQAPADTIPLLIRGGYVLPTQAPAVTTTLSRKNNFTLIAAADHTGSAKGTLFWDDGDSIDTIANGKYCLFDYELNDQLFTTRIVNWTYLPGLPYLNVISILGLRAPVSEVFVNSRPAKYTMDNKVLQITNIHELIDVPMNVYWTYNGTQW